MSFFKTRMIQMTLVLSIVLMSATSITAQPALAVNCPGAPASRIVVGRGARVAPGGTANNLRDKPSTSGKVLTQVPPGTYFNVLDGPSCAENYAWWKVDIGQIGWMAEGDSKQYFMEPTTSPVKEFTLTSNSKTIDIAFGNVGLTYNGAFSRSVQADTVFAYQQSTDNPMMNSTPAYTEFVFDDGKVQRFIKANLAIYPVSDYQKTDEEAAKRIANLQALLKDPSAVLPTVIPVLPIYNAAQVFHANNKLLTFNSGKGIRFLTMYAQDVSPVTNDRLMYIFQGITTDGKYYVSAAFPVSSTLLADKYEDVKDFPDMNSSNAGDLFQQYMKQTTDKLNKAAASDFTPNLDQIDAILQSINIK